MNKAEAKTYLAEGKQFYAAGDYDAAIASFTKSIEAHPSDDAYDYRGCAYLVKTEHEKAIADFTEAIEHCSPADRRGLSMTYYNRAEAYRRKEEKEKALEDLRKSLELDASNSNALKLYGFLTGSPFPPIRSLITYLGSGPDPDTRSHPGPGQMANHKDPLHSCVLLVLMGAVFWYGAGAVGLGISIESAGAPDKSTRLLICLRGAIPWGIFGMLSAGWYSLGARGIMRQVGGISEAHLQIFKNSYMLTTVFVVTLALVIFRSWYVPKMVLPEGGTLRAGWGGWLMHWLILIAVTLHVRHFVLRHITSLALRLQEKGANGASSGS